MKLVAGSNTVKGVINDGMDVEFAMKLGRFIGKYYGSPVAVAMDGRVSNVMLKTAFIAGVTAVGTDVLDLGTVPTPLIQYYMALHPEVRGGVTITASFSGQDINGFKVMKSGGIDDSLFYEHSVESIMAEKIPGVPGLQVGRIDKVEDFTEGYIDEVLSKVDTEVISNAGLRICVDCRNEAIVPIVSNILMRLSVEYISIGGDTSVLDLDRQVKLGQMVKSQGLDLGVAIEMDADHCLFSDDKGEAVSGDKSFSLLAKSLLSKKKGKVVIPINSSTLMEDVISENGGFAIHCAVGEYTIIRKVKENDAILGGDMFGCTVLPGEFCTSDAMVAMVKMLEIVAQNGPLSKQLKTFPDYFILKSSFDCPDDKTAETMEKFKALYDGKEMEMTDGVKVFLDNGWLLVRPSNVKGVVKIYSQADSREAAEKMVKDTIASLTS